MRTKSALSSLLTRITDKSLRYALITHSRFQSMTFQAKFVNLLEFCEDELKVKEVIAIFERADLSVNHGFPRTLRYVGFRSIRPNQLPEALSPDHHFAMTYKI